MLEKKLCRTCKFRLLDSTQEPCASCSIPRRDQWQSISESKEEYKEAQNESDRNS